jgi:aspartate beta-hydroxylase
MVERGILERFGAEETARVLTSWRLLEMDYVHREYVGDGDPGTSQCHQHCTSYVPGLQVKEFWDADRFPWCQKLASRYGAIRDEFLSVAADPDRLAREGNSVWAGALTEDARGYGEGWGTLVLMNRGAWDRTNAARFPVTARAVRDASVPAVEVFFASMKPRTNIKPHSDFTNFVLTSHLAVDIPYSGSNRCRLTVGDTTRQWINGQVTLFDTSVTHDAVNDSDRTRYILMMRVWHPDLTETERRALQFVWNCLEFPDLVSSDPTEREQAESQLQSVQGFPKLMDRGTARKQGFGGGARGERGGGGNKSKKKRRK